MKKRLTHAALILAFLCLITGCQNTRPDPAVPEDGLVFMTGSDQGTYYRFGQVLAASIAEETGTRLKPVISGGSQENLLAVQNGSAAVGFAQTDVLSYAWGGIRAYDRKADRVRVIAELYKEQVQIVTMDPSLRSVADLKGKSVSIGEAGSGVYFNAVDILSVYGLTEHDISPSYQSFGDAVSALQSGKIDAAFVVAGAPTSAVSGIAATTDIYLIGLDEEHIQKLTELSPFYSRAVISRRTYNTYADITTVAVGAVLVAGRDVPEEDVYHILSGIYEHLDAISKKHSKGTELELSLAAGITSVPYHPGAARYFAEKGLTVLAEH